MWAVYGLSEDGEHAEKFLGYIPASFFKDYADADKWDVKFVDLPDGTKRLGWHRGRALFCNVGDLRADMAEIEWYMNPPPTRGESPETAPGGMRPLTPPDQDDKIDPD